jgi:hypothetical protein
MRLRQSRDTDEQGHPHYRPDAASDQVLRASYYDIPERSELLNGLEEKGQPGTKTTRTDLSRRATVNLGRELHDIALIWRRISRLRPVGTEGSLLLPGETGFKLRHSLRQADFGL